MDDDDPDDSDTDVGIYANDTGIDDDDWYSYNGPDEDDPYANPDMDEGSDENDPYPSPDEDPDDDMGREADDGSHTYGRNDTKVLSISVICTFAM
jgi:hypothetical protein